MEKYFRPLLFMALISLMAWFYLGGGSQYLSFEFMQAKLLMIKELHERHPFPVTAAFFFSIFLLASLSIPGSIVLTVLAGAIFGVLPGTVIVCLATTAGGCVAFLMARFLFRDYVAKKFEKQFRKIDRKINEEGFSYLFTIRLIPASPFVVINLVMGLTSMNMLTFAVVTFVGMFPGTMIYVYAGRKFSELESLSGIMSPPIIVSLLSLSILPYVVKLFIKMRARQPRTKEQVMNQRHHRNSYYTMDGVEFEGEDQARFGRGPKGHMRSDELIKEDASEILKDHHEIDASDIELTVEEGCIFLRGDVESRYIKRLAEESVEDVIGVRDVINQLTVRSIGLIKDVPAELSNDLPRDEELRKQKLS